MDINTTTLVGRLTADPELRTSAGGTPVCTLRLASNRAPKDGKDQGAVFIDVVSFNRLAEAISENLEQGRQVAVTGRIEFRQWQTDDGSRRSKRYVIANQVQFLAKPASNGSQPEPAYAEGEEPFLVGPRGRAAANDAGRPVPRRPPPPNVAPARPYERGARRWTCRARRDDPPPRGIGQEGPRGLPPGRHRRLLGRRAGAHR